MLPKETRIFKIIGEETFGRDSNYVVKAMVPYYDSNGSLSGLEVMNSHPDDIIFDKRILDEKGCIMVEVVDDNLLNVLRILYGPTK